MDQNKTGPITIYQKPNYYEIYSKKIYSSSKKKPLKEDLRTPIEKHHDKHTTKKTTTDRLLTIFQDLYGENGYEKSSHSMSTILEYSIVQLITAYKNNATTHFIKYPKHLISCILLLENEALAIKEARRIAAKITGHFMFNESIEEEYTEYVTRFGSLFPYLLTLEELGQELELDEGEEHVRMIDVAFQPWRYINKMVYIKQQLENIRLEQVQRGEEGENVLKKLKLKTYNPIPFHSSNIPMHIRLDTHCLVQLLISKERIDTFKTLYEYNNPGENLNISTKANISSSFKNIFGRNPDPDNPKEEGLFKTELWKFFCDLTNKKLKKELRPTIKKEKYV